MDTVLAKHYLCFQVAMWRSMGKMGYWQRSPPRQHHCRKA